MTLPKKYDHKSVESGRYKQWKKRGYFKSGDTSKEPFTIVIPPPNVTGKLHLGHAWDNTLQDLIIRYKRMRGYDALYLPGMDHAGIATQAKIDARLRERGTNRYELGREKFLEEAWRWKEEYAEFIREQWEALGISVDYDKECFTLDDNLSKAVNHVFIKLYEKGLIYRGERIINWDVEAKTALSNIEVEYKEVDGALYYFKYFLEDKSDYVLIATTRPETMFGDTAVMVHPDDEKRRKFVGKHVLIPGTDVKIPVIEDAYVDREFGTGAVKVTPAHDPNDFEVGKRHDLPMPHCMEEDGTMNEMAFQYEGMTRFACRKQLVDDLKARGLLEKIETHVHSVGHSERTGVVVEPRKSLQWFVKMDPLAKQALEKSSAKFVPARFEKIFKRWMEDIQDWCISRQLWWGHRIPAYYKDGDVYVGNNPPAGYTQDDDVLDTWFSSALWPFSTLGWPDETEDFKRYYPTQTMVTGYDIIFFWVARMIFQGLEFTNETPFEDVLIHGLIRDAQGRKMSKSLGNGVDPMDVKATYGIDTLRYFLTTNSAPGQDLRYEEEKVQSSWNFINKLWNIARFALMHIEDSPAKSLSIEGKTLGLAERWILSRYTDTLEEVEAHFDRYEFGEAAKRLYIFAWEEFASWYIETAKVPLSGEDHAAKEAAKATVATVLMGIMKMLHPFMPFMTEAVYEKLPNRDAESIMISTWPKQAVPRDKTSEQAFELVKSVIVRIRKVRNDYKVPNSKPIDIIIVGDRNAQTVLRDQTALIKRFVNPETLSITDKLTTDEETVSHVLDACTVYIPLGSLIDVSEELKKQEAERDRLQKEIARAEGMLNNQNFVSKAPPAKVDAEREKLTKYENQLKYVQARIEDLKQHV